jgi:hypothetical protein
MGYFDEAKAAKLASRAKPTISYLTPDLAGSAAPYAAAALAGEAAQVAAHEEGGRNERLNLAWFNMGRHVGAGTIGLETVRVALADAARACGLPDHEITKTLRDGPTSAAVAGAAYPRVPATQATSAATVLPEVSVEDFWQQRESLAAIHQYARARMVSPWALLGVTLARILTAVPHHVVLPPIIGGTASLNLFVAVVGRSGDGKGASMRTADEAVDLGIGIDIRQVGSGEGLAKLFAHRDKGAVVRDRYSLLADIPEVDTLAALGGRQSSTLMPQLRQAWSGELLGFGYSDPTKAIHIEPHSYRLCAVLGVQPGRAGPLFAETDGGTPQRFLWVWGTDKNMPDTEPQPPERLRLNAYQGWTGTVGGQLVLPIPEVAIDTTKTAHRQRARGEADALDGHALLLREKVMVALAVLDGRRVPIEDDWRVAGQVMAHSDRSRERVQAVLRASEEQKAEAAGRYQGVRADVAEETIDARKLARAVKSIRGHLTDEWVPASKLRSGLSSGSRECFEEALDLLVKAGDVEVEEVEYKGQPGQRVRGIA